MPWYAKSNRDKTSLLQWYEFISETADKNDPYITFVLNSISKSFTSLVKLLKPKHFLQTF